MSSLEVHVGHGFDVHRVGTDPDRPLILGGCVFPGLPGLVGHSDGDAIAHAVADGLLGATGLGDLGELFPDTDATLQGADSIELLRRVAAMTGDQRWTIGNADCSVVCESPKLAPLRAQMQQRLSDAIGAPVSVKGRRAEGLGAIGRGEGVACFAAVVVTRGAG